MNNLLVVGKKSFGDRFGINTHLISVEQLYQILSPKTLNVTEISLEPYEVNMYMFTITRFFVAIFLNGLYVATFTYSMELLNSKFRTFTGVNIQAQFAVGYVILGFLRAVDLIEHHKSNFCASHNQLFRLIQAQSLKFKL